MDVGIRAFVGPNGSGKTLGAMALVVRPAWERGIPVVSNLTLRPEALGFDPALFVPLVTWRQIPELRDCVLFLDEIQATFPSRESRKMPAELGRILNQLRKPNVQLTLTAPAWTRADIIIRECVQFVTLCSGSLPDRWVREPTARMVRQIARDEHGKAMRVDTTGWLPNRLFRYKTYDATQFDEFTLGRAAKLRAVSTTWYWRQSKGDDLAYATSDQVCLLDHLEEDGTCWKCGGRRTRIKCSCALGEESEAQAKRAEATALGAVDGPG